MNFTALDDALLIPQLREQGCAGVLVPATEMALFSDVQQLKTLYPDMVYTALGLHPYFLQHHLIEHLEVLDKTLHQTRPDALGEFGLDWMLQQRHTEEQYHYFRQQLMLAKAHQLPLVIHCRKAHDQVASEVSKAGFTQGGFIHGFSGSIQQAKRYLDLGFVLGLGGALTYPRAKAMHKMVAALPDDGFTLETDSPDMPPAFAQGKVNTPLNIPKIAQYIAQIRNTRVEHIFRVSSQNFHNTLAKGK